MPSREPPGRVRRGSLTPQLADPMHTPLDTCSAWEHILPHRRRATAYRVVRAAPPWRPGGRGRGSPCRTHLRVDRGRYGKPPGRRASQPRGRGDRRPRAPGAGRLDRRGGRQGGQRRHRLPLVAHLDRQAPPGGRDTRRSRRQHRPSLALAPRRAHGRRAWASTASTSRSGTGHGCARARPPCSSGRSGTPSPTRWHPPSSRDGAPAMAPSRCGSQRPTSHRSSLTKPAEPPPSSDEQARPTVPPHGRHRGVRRTSSSWAALRGAPRWG